LLEYDFTYELLKLSDATGALKDQIEGMSGLIPGNRTEFKFHLVRTGADDYERELAVRCLLTLDYVCIYRIQSARTVEALFKIEGPRRAAGPRDANLAPAQAQD
jgi:hypothetical protein